MNILIVDDEPYMREMYLHLFNWEENGFSLVGVAHSAMNALEIMKNTNIDVVITDVKMPLMTGIDLIKKAKNEFPKVRFIVMSGYDDFSLVREAFTLGIKDYFLKHEIVPKKIIEILTELKKEIEEENKNISNIHNIKTTVPDTKYKSIVVEKLIKELIWGRYPQKSLQRLKEHNICIDNNDICVIVISIVNYYNLEKNVWNGEREIFKYALLNVLNEICERYGEFYPCFNLPDEYLILCSQDKKADFDNFFRDISEEFSQCLSLYCNYGYSSTAHRDCNIKDIYQEAKKACEFCFVKGNNSIVSYDEIKYLTDEIDLSTYFLKLKKLFQNANISTLKENISGIQIPASYVSLNQINDIKKYFGRCYNEMIRVVENYDITKEKVESVFAFEELVNKSDLNELNSWLKESLSEISRAVSNFDKLQKAKQYIAMHYSEQLSLYIVAEELGISSGHLSRLFQQSDGGGFLQFLTRRRIAEAKVLLTTTNLKVYEVAEKVGYLNAEQFTKIFKKEVGISPKEFRK